MRRTTRGGNGAPLQALTAALKKGQRAGELNEAACERIEAAIDQLKAGSGAAGTGTGRRKRTTRAATAERRAA
jgi:hypothetical protein